MCLCVLCVVQSRVIYHRGSIQTVTNILVLGIIHSTGPSWTEQISYIRIYKSFKLNLITGSLNALDSQFITVPLQWQ